MGSVLCVSVARRLAPCAQGLKVVMRHKGQLALDGRSAPGVFAGGMGDNMRDVVLQDFLGAWRVDRVITHGDGTRARFAGQAVWTETDDGATYMETGHLILPTGQFAAERTYLWGHDLRVFFDDGRFFHQVPCAGGVSDHWCDPDQYDAEYDFGDWPIWSCRWRVRGPRKDYTMQSQYTRQFRADGASASG